jgi:folylpolyglutamate synthase/dihydropteroate synthase
VQQAFARAAQDRFVIVAGSLYLIGEALELLGEKSAADERTLNEWSVRPR